MLVVILALCVMWAVWKVLRAKPKVIEKAPETLPPPPKPEAVQMPSQQSFMVTFSKDYLAEMEQLCLITGAQNFKELVHFALAHYGGIIYHITKGQDLYIKNSDGKFLLIESPQIMTAKQYKANKIDA